MTQVSDRLASLSPSETLAMSQKSNELKAQGIDVINLSVGEPDFFTPDHIKEAAKKAVDDNYSFYSPVPGYLDLRKAIVAKLKNENGLTYTTDQIIVSGGAKQSVCNVLLSIIGPGDEVIVPAPYWVSYVEMVKLAEGTNVVISAGIEQDFKITPAQLEAAITPKSKAIILCSPSNPTGSVYSKEELAGLAEVLAKYPNIIVLSDEIYEHINYVGAHESIAQFESIRDRVVVINGVSKAYAMTGLRLGYITAPSAIISAMNLLHQNVVLCANSTAQYGAIAALKYCQKDVEAMVAEYDARRKIMIAAFKAMNIPLYSPEGAFYVFPCIKETGLTSMEFVEKLLDEEDVLVIPGSIFGNSGEGFIRCSYAYSQENLKIALERIAKFINKYRK